MRYTGESGTLISRQWYELFCVFIVVMTTWSMDVLLPFRWNQMVPSIYFLIIRFALGTTWIDWSGVYHWIGDSKLRSAQRLYSNWVINGLWFASISSSCCFVSSCFHSMTRFFCLSKQASRVIQYHREIMTYAIQQSSLQVWVDSPRLAILFRSDITVGSFDTLDADRNFDSHSYKSCKKWES